MCVMCRTDQLVEVYIVRWRLGVFPERCWSLSLRSLGRGWRNCHWAWGCGVDTQTCFILWKHTAVSHTRNIQENGCKNVWILHIVHVCLVDKWDWLVLVGAHNTCCSCATSFSWNYRGISFNKSLFKNTTRWKKKKKSTKAVSPQQFPLPEDWVVDRVKRLQADVQILNSHVGQLLCMGLLDSCNHRLETWGDANTLPVNLPVFLTSSKHWLVWGDFFFFFKEQQWAP